MKGLYPVTITKNIKECADFYKKHFDFTVVFEQDWYIQLLHEKSGVEMGFMMPNHESQPKELHPAFNGNGIIVSLETSDAKKEYDRLAKTLADEMVMAYTEEEWGQKHFILRDPAGVYVDVVQQAKD